MAEIDKAFLGVGWSFPPEFHRHGDSLAVKMVAEEDDIRESLTILLSTRPGERIMLRPPKAALPWTRAIPRAASTTKLRVMTTRGTQSPT